ncbi:MAG TPA: hypothetical protein VN690_03865 [Terriglobales bacterium]|nr:hypothetical protein [Terriglobales bacterium]
MTLEGSHLCPACFEQKLNQGALASLRQSDVLYDSIALWAGWGWILVYFSYIFVVPAVMYLSIAKWRAPKRYLVPRRRWRYCAAWVGLLLPVALFAALLLIPANQRGGR